MGPMGRMLQCSKFVYGQASVEGLVTATDAVLESLVMVTVPDVNPAGEGEALLMVRVEPLTEAVMLESLQVGV